MNQMMVVMQHGQPLYQLYIKAHSLEQRVCQIPVSKLAFAVSDIVSTHHALAEIEASLDPSVQTMSVWAAYKAILSPWLRALPILESLQTSALRPRHWILIMLKIKYMLPQPMPKILPLGLERSRVDASTDAIDEFLSAVQGAADGTHASRTSTGSMTSEFRARLHSLTADALSGISTLSLMCLICCLPNASTHDLDMFPQLAQREIHVEKVIERVEGFLADAVLPLTQVPESPALTDSDDIRIVSVSALQQLMTGVDDCRMQLLLLKQHPYAGVFLENVNEILEAVVSVESCLRLLVNVQEAWLRSRSYISMIGTQYGHSSQMLQPGDLRILVDNQKLMSKVIAQIQATPSVLDVCSSSSVIPRILPVIWQNLEGLTSSISSMIFENRIKFAELFALNDFQAVEVLSMGCNVRYLDGEIQHKFYRTYNMFPSIEGIRVAFISSTNFEGSESYVTMQTAEMVSGEGERCDLLEHSHVSNGALETLADAMSAAKTFIAASHSRAHQEIVKRSAVKLDHRTNETSPNWILFLLDNMPVNPLLLALWTFFTELIESSLDRIATFSSPAASCDDIFLETARFLGLCSREVSKAILSVVSSNKKAHLETVLTGVMTLDEIMKALRDRVSNGQCNGPHDFDWFCHFRYYFNTSRGVGSGNLMVEVAGIKRAYSFQPVSGAAAVALPMVAASARVAVAVVSAVSANMIPLLVGPAGSGKSTVVGSVAAWLGQPCLVIDACCDEAAANRWTTAVACGGYWGLVVNAHQYCSKVGNTIGENSETSGGNMLGMRSLTSQISLIIRTLAEYRRNGRVGATMLVQGRVLSLRSSAAFVACGRATDANSLSSFSQQLRNATRTVFVQGPSPELLFTIALRVNAGINGSRARIMASQLETLARSAAAFGGCIDGYPIFNKATFVTCVRSAAKSSKNEGEFLRRLLFEVQGRVNPASFAIFRDIHKALLGGDAVFSDIERDPSVFATAPASSLAALATADRDDIASELRQIVNSVGLAPSPQFCRNVLKLSGSIELGRSVMVSGLLGSGRSSTITTAFGLLKSRCTRTNSHVPLMPEAQTRAQLFGTFDVAGGGVWLKGIFQHWIGSGLNVIHDEQRLKTNDDGKGDDGMMGSAGDCRYASRVCFELDCGLDGELMDLLTPALEGGNVPLNDGSSLPVHLNALFILKTCSFDKCSPTVLNHVTLVSCSLHDVEAADIMQCSIRRSAHPLKEHVVKVATALLLPCFSSPPCSVMSTLQYRCHAISFFNSMMVHMLAYNAGLHDSETNDPFGMIGEVTVFDMERFTAFACMWAAGAELDSDARIKLSIHLRSYDLSGWFPTDIPQNKSIFDYFPVCDVATGGQWVEWGAALPTGTALHNILSQSSQSFNRTRAVINPCSRRVYVPTTQSVAMTFLCDLLLPRAGDV